MCLQFCNPETCIKVHEQGVVNYEDRYTTTAHGIQPTSLVCPICRMKSQEPQLEI